MPRTLCVAAGSLRFYLPCLREALPHVYYFARICLTSFGGTEQNPGRLNRPSAAPDPSVLIVVIGQLGRAGEWETVDPQPLAMENTGREHEPEPDEEDTRSPPMVVTAEIGGSSCLAYIAAIRRASCLVKNGASS